MRHPVAGRSREGGPAEPGAEAGVRTGSPTHDSTSPAAPHDGAIDASPERQPLTEAQILVGTTLWLADLRDRLAEELDLADGATLAVPRTTLEAMRDGLARCVTLLDGLSIDPTQFPRPEPSPAAPIPPAPSSARLQ